MKNRGPRAALALTGVLALMSAGRAGAHDPEKHDSKAAVAAKPSAAELAAFEKARPVFERNCFRCHTTAGKKAKPKSLEHLKMDGYPFGGHHADMVGSAVRDAVKGKDGKDPTMPKDEPGALKGADLDAVLAWAGAWERAHPGDRGEMPSDHAGHADHGSAGGGPTAAMAYTCPMHPEVRSTQPGRCPKCGMTLVAVAAANPAPTTQPDAALVAVIDAWHRALADRSVAKLAEVVDEDLLVLEGIHKNVGWPDFRDNHIGPEMKEWTDFKVAENHVIEARTSGDLGYGVSEGVIRITSAGKPAVLQVAETFVFTRRQAGWRIKHIQMALKPISATAPPATAHKK